MTTEYREHLEKSINKYSDDAKEAMRKVRRDVLDDLKKAKTKMGKDDAHRQEKQVSAHIQRWPL
jgi:ribosome recycling factor